MTKSGDSKEPPLSMPITVRQTLFGPLVSSFVHESVCGKNEFSMSCHFFVLFKSCHPRNN